MGGAAGGAGDRAAGDMILRAARIAAVSGHAATADHVFAGGANQAIHLLQGCPADLQDMVRDAAAAGRSTRSGTTSWPRSRTPPASRRLR